MNTCGIGSHLKSATYSSFWAISGAESEVLSTESHLHCATYSSLWFFSRWVEISFNGVTLTFCDLRFSLSHISRRVEKSFDGITLKICHLLFPLSCICRWVENSSDGVTLTFCHLLFSPIFRRCWILCHEHLRHRRYTYTSLIIAVDSPNWLRTFSLYSHLHNITCTSLLFSEVARAWVLLARYSSIDVNTCARPRLNPALYDFTRYQSLLRNISNLSHVVWECIVTL